MTLEETIQGIKPLNEKMMETARIRWNTIAHPLHSLGKLEDLVTQIVGITGNPTVDISKKALVAMCADNGVVEEGVTQTGQEITALVANGFLEGTTTVCAMCRKCGVDIYPVDVGIAVDTNVRRDLKVAYGTKNMTKGPAMTREEAIRAIESGIRTAEELKEKGYKLLATGEMGIGNNHHKQCGSCCSLRPACRSYDRTGGRAVQRGPGTEDKCHKESHPGEPSRSSGCAGCTI